MSCGSCAICGKVGHSEVQVRPAADVALCQPQQITRWRMHLCIRRALLGMAPTAQAPSNHHHRTCFCTSSPGMMRRASSMAALRPGTSSMAGLCSTSRSAGGSGQCLCRPMMFALWVLFFAVAKAACCSGKSSECIGQVSHPPLPPNTRQPVQRTNIEVGQQLPQLRSNALQPCLQHAQQPHR